MVSLAGAVTLLSDAVWRKDPVFILDQSAGLAVCACNLSLLARALYDTHAIARVIAAREETGSAFHGQACHAEFGFAG